MGFPDAVREAGQLWQAQLVQEPEMAAFIRDEKRALEAEQVSSLVARLARAELAGHALGRVGTGPRMFPPMKAHIDGWTGDESEIIDSIHVAVAIGYLGLAGHEHGRPDAVRRDRSERQIWDFWLPRINLGFFDAAGIHRDNVSFIRNFAGTQLAQRAQAAGITGFRKKGKLQRSGAYLGQMGMMLRAAQADWADQEAVVNPSPVMAHDWPFDQYSP